MNIWRWFVGAEKELEDSAAASCVIPLRIWKEKVAGQDALLFNRALTADEETLVRRIWEEAYTSARKAEPITVLGDMN